MGEDSDFPAFKSVDHLHAPVRAVGHLEPLLVLRPAARLLAHFDLEK